MTRQNPEGHAVSIIHGELPATPGTHQLITIDAESPMHVAPQEWLTAGDRYVVEIAALRELPDGTRVLSDLSRAVYFLARKNGTIFKMPVLSANGQEAEAVWVFTTVERATLYLQVVRWDE